VATPNGAYTGPPAYAGYAPYQPRFTQASASNASSSSHQPSTIATSHHRAEDAQPNEAANSTRQHAPPQLQLATSSSSADARPRDANWGGTRGRGSSRGRGGAASRGGPFSRLFIKKPTGIGRGSMAGGWADSPRSAIASREVAVAAAGPSQGKGKERERDPPFHPDGFFAPAPRSQPRTFYSSEQSTLGGQQRLPPPINFPPSASSSANLPCSISPAPILRGPRNSTIIRAPAPIPPPTNPTFNSRLYVSHIPTGTTENQLRSLFDPFGTMYVLSSSSTVAR
jgi:hypothetical protein